MELLEIIEIIMQIVIFIGVIVAVFSLRQQKKISQLAFFADYTKRCQEIMLKIPDDLDNETDLKNEYKPYLRAYFDLCWEQWFLHKKGHIEDEFWEEWKDGMVPIFKKAVVFDYLKTKKSSYPDFYKFVVDEFIKPKTKPTIYLKLKNILKNRELIKKPSKIEG